ncbi:MAG: alpha/beta hydrolase [Acidobacteriota bacterium]
MLRLDFADPARAAWSDDGARPLRTSVWYPTTGSAMGKVLAVPADRPIFVGGPALLDVPIAEGRHPVLVLSHGTGGAAFQTMWLGRRLAARGWIVAAVDHHGNTAAEDAYDPRGFLMPWERARDLSVVIDRLVAHPEVGPRLDLDRIAIGGFSLGGYSALAAAGAQADRARFDAFCASDARDATCGAQTEFPEAVERFEAMLVADPALRGRLVEVHGDFTDERVKAAVLLAPAVAQIFTEESLRGLDLPVLVVAGDQDVIAPSVTNAEYISSHVPDARLETIAGAGHYTFLNPCTAHGRRHVPLCAEPEVVRDDVHGEVAERIAAFLAEVLLAE